jgi:hypothetical protein
MKRTYRGWGKRYLLSFYPAEGTERVSLKILLREGTAGDAKKLSQKPHKKSIFALESGPS